MVLDLVGRIDNLCRRIPLGFSLSHSLSHTTILTQGKTATLQLRLPPSSTFYTTTITTSGSRATDNGGASSHLIAPTTLPTHS